MAEINFKIEYNGSISYYQVEDAKSIDAAIEFVQAHFDRCTILKYNIKKPTIKSIKTLLPKKFETIYLKKLGQRCSSYKVSLFGRTLFKIYAPIKEKNNIVGKTTILYNPFSNKIESYRNDFFKK